MMARLSAKYENEILTIRPLGCGEGGWYIENHFKTWKLFEVHEHGGAPQFVDVFNSFSAAHKKAESLT